MVVAALLLLAGCSSARSTSNPAHDGGDMQLSFPDGWADAFVPPTGAALRSELVCAGGASSATQVELQMVLGEAVQSEAATGGGYTLQWDSVVLPQP